ncbi:uncharacterized protein A1O5_00244 [Cladophialophora psammophila CBS 110553]|uniref:Uncharacterized protein n=1 Tax=Cladophialophora psammophila CBS 110553 TaxID=1182543 RepID=W9X5H1_9EURO|nr:uncharacterized protein A1O5_00244 [Cladophialophora psammophila CBS 110553]EXJ75737.1 hypothetical protein A1O5_00244 [Cladophialophora psammophila CBS 110553]
MCVTEIWSYRECGCFYHHKLLCQSQRREQTPCFAPNIQYPLDRWLKETAIAAEASCKQFRPRATSIEPQDCPDHDIVEKSFLNQICEDCLLAELSGISSALEKGASAQDVSAAVWGNGEGLIWDSEVKIEIEDQNSGFSASPTAPEASGRNRGILNEDRRILESHVEIIIEDESHSLSAENAASPRIIARQQSGRSQQPVIEPSPPNSRRVGSCKSSSSAPSSKRYGRAFHNINVIGFDPENDIGAGLERSHRNLQPIFCGMSLMRSNLRNAQGCEPDADIHPVTPRARIGIKSLPKFQSLRSLSTSFRMAPRSLIVASSHGTDLPSPSSSVGSSPKNPFRNICSREGLPLGGETSTSLLGGSEQRSDNVHHESTPIPEVQDTPAILPRKSSLKDFALFLMEDFTWTKRMVQPWPGSQPRSLPPSPTTSWLRNHTASSVETNSTTGEFVSRSNTVFETASRASSLKTDRTEGLKPDEGLMIPSLPKSSTMNTMRAIISGYIDRDFGHDDTDKAVVRPPMSGKGETGRQGRWADGTDLGRTDMPEQPIQEESSDQERSEGNTEDWVHPVLSTSSRSTD